MAEDSEQDLGTSDYSSMQSEATSEETSGSGLNASTCSSSDNKELGDPHLLLQCLYCPYTKVCEKNRGNIGKHIKCHSTQKSTKGKDYTCRLCTYTCKTKLRVLHHEATHYDFLGMMKSRGQELNGWRAWTAEDSIHCEVINRPLPEQERKSCVIHLQEENKTSPEND